MSRPRLVVAAHILVYVNGRLLGRCCGFEWQSTTQVNEARGIDISYVQELMPGIVGVSGTMQVLRLHGDGGMQGAGIVAQQVDASREKYFTLLLRDRATDLPLFKADMCKATSEEWRAAPRDRVLGTVSFNGILWTNEKST